MAGRFFSSSPSLLQHSCLSEQPQRNAHAGGCQRRARSHTLREKGLPQSSPDRWDPSPARDTSFLHRRVVKTGEAVKLASFHGVWGAIRKVTSMKPFHGSHSTQLHVTPGGKGCGRWLMRNQVYQVQEFNPTLRTVYLSQSAIICLKWMFTRHTHTHIILQTKCELPVAVPPVPALSTPQGLVYSIQTIHV